MIAGSTREAERDGGQRRRRLLEVAGRGRLVASDRQHQREHPRPERQPERLGGGPHAGVDADAARTGAPGVHRGGVRQHGQREHLAPRVADAHQRHGRVDRAHRRRLGRRARAGRRGPAPGTPRRTPCACRPGRRRPPTPGSAAGPAPRSRRTGSWWHRTCRARPWPGSPRPRACNPWPGPAARRWSAAAGSHGHRPRSAAGRPACRARAAPRRPARAGCPGRRPRRRPR